MECIKDEAEVKIEEKFKIKDEDPEEQTDLAGQEMKTEIDEAKEDHVSVLSEKSSSFSPKSIQDRASTTELCCQQCGRTFGYPSRLIGHMRTHTGEKPFTCQQCGKKFYQKGLLNFHMKTHSGERPFVCTKCGKRFYHKRSLNTHIRTHTGEKPYLCPFCGKSFAQTGHFDSHVNRHLVHARETD